MECCSLEVMAELLELVYSSHRKPRSCLIYGRKAFPEITCDFLSCILLGNDLTFESEELLKLSAPSIYHKAVGTEVYSRQT